ncbi:helix-turn-helix transcriptional regulator [Williamsia sp.]|uniref:helix-turn-helix domain-containing protein n=1 Tax=Williamsia sp. TaxID=1872085 RepID=UPI002F94CA0A
MADKKNPLGPTGIAVSANIKRLREAQRITFAELSRRLTEIGRPIATLGLSRIETGDRRVDVDDLMALAVALDVAPGRLLSPEGFRIELTHEFEVTGMKPVTAERLWQFVEGYWSPNGTGLGFVFRSRPGLGRGLSFDDGERLEIDLDGITVERRVRIDDTGVVDSQTSMMRIPPQQKGGTDGDD